MGVDADGIDPPPMQPVSAKASGAALMAQNLRDVISIFLSPKLCVKYREKSRLEQAPYPLSAELQEPFLADAQQSLAVHFA